MMYDEYLRRNLLVCKAVGAHANATAALQRLRAQKRPPKWLLKYLEGIAKRCEPLPAELAEWRNMSWDAPFGVFMRTRLTKRQPNDSGDEHA